MRRGRRANALSLQATMPPFLPGLVDRRFLWGGFGLFTSLDTDIAALLSGPDAGRWRDAIGDALSSTHRRAPREMQRLEDEPDLKRGPGGLRDLRRAIWANTPASARPMSLTQAPLIEAHRFLWLCGRQFDFFPRSPPDRLSFAPPARNELQKSRRPPTLGPFRCHAPQGFAAL